MRVGRRVGAILVLGVVAATTDLRAQSPQSDDEGPLAIRYSLKSSGLLVQTPDDPTLFPDQRSATGLLRGRVEPTVQVNETTKIEVAFEQRLRVFTSESGIGGTGVLPSEAEAPFRLRQLDWQFASGSHGEWRGEIDRAAIHAQIGAANVTVGRQAIGWGRGVLFGAIDLFAPFSPLEADREWRRGVDAVRGDVKLAERASFEGVAALGPDVDRSAFAGRLRGYAGNADVEVVGGRRARDVFAGAAASGAVGGAELHGEVALFRTPAEAGSVAFAEERSIGKVVAGASYQFPVGNGLLVYGEYHYSGFGASSAEGILPLLLDPAFRERYLRGDTQVLGRHVVATLASYEWSPERTYSAQWLQSGIDGSGVVIASTTLTFSDRSSLLLDAYLPYGSAPMGATLGSQFGSLPLSLFVQLRIYR